MIEHGIHEQDYLGICKNYRCVYDTNTIQEDKVAKDPLVSSVADPDPGSGAFLTPGSGIRDG
jgi:hypothetical protein